MLKLYTDGACSNNGGNNSVGGWAYIIIDENENIIAQGYGAEYNTTNNIMEYTAMLKGLTAIDKIFHEEKYNCLVECYTDSALLYNTLTQWIEGWRANGWKRKSGPIKNLELVKALYPFTKCEYFHFNHVRGHAGDKWNELCDTEAVKARLTLEENK